NPAELALLHSFADPRSLAEAIAASGLAELEALAALARWMEAGYLVETGARSSSRVAAEATVPPDPTAFEATPRTRESARPFTISVTPPEPETWRRGAAQWIWAALAAVTMTIPAAYVLGTRTAQVQRATTEAAAPVLTTPPREAVPSSYLVEVQVAPAEAKLQLDGNAPVAGHLRVSLERNGATHELRASAPGFRPARIAFADVAPAAQLQLEPIASSTAACPDNTSHQEDQSAAAPSAPPVPAAPPALATTESTARTSRAAPERTDETNPRLARPRPRTSKAPVPRAPRVQVIGQQPVVRVID
ncbi:MAG TPA: hypothetical protein VG963_05890, partial [Polyangiaceae bacterium]|nr:hypothetical protein [Polyangiaceae bacterium]